jgi:hypothetical protein
MKLDFRGKEKEYLNCIHLFSMEPVVGFFEHCPETETSPTEYTTPQKLQIKNYT